MPPSQATNPFQDGTAGAQPWEAFENIDWGDWRATKRNENQDDEEEAVAKEEESVEYFSGSLSTLTDSTVTSHSTLTSNSTSSVSDTADWIRKSVAESSITTEGSTSSSSTDTVEWVRRRLAKEATFLESRTSTSASDTAEWIRLKVAEEFAKRTAREADHNGGTGNDIIKSCLLPSLASRSRSRSRGRNTEQLEGSHHRLQDRGTGKNSIKKGHRRTNSSRSRSTSRGRNNEHLEGSRHNESCRGLMRSSSQCRRAAFAASRQRVDMSLRRERSRLNILDDSNANANALGKMDGHRMPVRRVARSHTDPNEMRKMQSSLHRTGSSSRQLASEQLRTSRQNERVPRGLRKAKSVYQMTTPMSSASRSGKSRSPEQKNATFESARSIDGAESRTDMRRSRTTDSQAFKTPDIMPKSNCLQQKSDALELARRIKEAERRTPLRTSKTMEGPAVLKTPDSLPYLSKPKVANTSEMISKLPPPRENRKSVRRTKSAVSPIMKSQASSSPPPKMPSARDLSRSGGCPSAA